MARTTQGGAVVGQPLPNVSGLARGHVVPGMAAGCTELLKPVTNEWNKDLQHLPLADLVLRLHVQLVEDDAPIGFRSATEGLDDTAYYFVRPE